MNSATPYCYSYSSSEKRYTVGFFNGAEWHELYDTNSKKDAIELISFLNGGQRPHWFREPPVDAKSENKQQSWPFSTVLSWPTAIGWLGEVLCSPPIAVISFNRPDYLRQLLASLAAQQPAIEPRRMHLFQDGTVNRYSSIRYAEDADIAASLALFRDFFPQGHVHASPDNIGITENILRAEKFFFEELRAPVGYFFEDDLALSPHYVAALDLMRRGFARFDRIVYYNANGEHRASLEQQRTNARKLVFMGHFWGFALKRSHWLRLQSFLANYYRLVTGRDERVCPCEDVRALFRSWGKSQTHPNTGQDAAKDLATHLMGRWRASCYPAFGRYIGAQGTHFTPNRFREFGFDETIIYPEPLGKLDLHRHEVERMIDESLAGRSREFTKVYADQIAAQARA